MATARAPHPMASALDAIHVILALLDEDPDTTLVALVDRLPHAQRAVVPVEGGDPGPAGVEALAALLATACREAPEARVVLVSVRHGGGDHAEEADLAAWRRLVARDRQAPPVLLDWFVVNDVAIISLAELAGPRPRWGA